MIFIYELICKKHSHEVCNAGFVKLYSISYPNEKIVFTADSTHINCIQSELENSENIEENILYKNISFSQNGGIIYFIKKFLFLKKEKKKWKNNKVIFLSYNIYILKILEFLFKKEKETQTNILLVSHGTLELLKNNKNNPRENFKNPNTLVDRIKIKIRQPYKLFNLLIIKFKNIYNKFTNFPVSIFFKDFESILNSFNLPSISLVVLSEHIDLELKKMKCLEKIKRYIIPLPVIKKKINIPKINSTINFGIIGYGNPEAQLELLSSLKKEKVVNKFNLRLIGLQPDIFRDYGNVITAKGKNQLLMTRYEMEKHISEIHFQIILYPENSYKLSQSLSVFEALRYQKPIIHLKNPCVSFYNQKNCPIGIQCLDINEMSYEIKRLIYDPEMARKNYDFFLKNLREVSEKYSINETAKKIVTLY